ncbi:hypothetical protein ANG2_1843, partial [Streptococcus constellatus subsp. constellatus SK53]
NGKGLLEVIKDVLIGIVRVC